MRRRWAKEGSDDHRLDGIAVRRAKRDYIVYPQDARMTTFAEAVRDLNCACALTVSADVVRLVVSSFPEGADTFSLTAQDNIQIVETMAE